MKCMWMMVKVSKITIFISCKITNVWWPVPSIKDHERVYAGFSEGSDSKRWESCLEELYKTMNVYFPGY